MVDTNENGSQMAPKNVSSHSGQWQSSAQHMHCQQLEKSKNTDQIDQLNWGIHDNAKCKLAQRIVASLCPKYTLEIGLWAYLVNSK